MEFMWQKTQITEQTSCFTKGESAAHHQKGIEIYAYAQNLLIAWRHFHHFVVCSGGEFDLQIVNLGVWFSRNDVRTDHQLRYMLHFYCNR